MTRYDNQDTFRKPWYQLSAHRHASTLGVPQGTVNSDVCIIGGGFTGLSAALELASAGYDVTVLETGPCMAFDASGRNGGHICRGWSKSPRWLAAHYGQTMAKALCDMSLEGIDLIRQRVETYAIDCDLHFGYISAALHHRHQREFAEEMEEWASFGYDGFYDIPDHALGDYVRSPLYISGLGDNRSGHFHPYNYAQGIAVAAQNHSARLYSQSHVTHIDFDASGKKPVIVHLKNGARIVAQHAIVAGAINLPQMKKPLTTSISARAHMIATEPLGDTATDILPRNVAVADANFVLTYFRKSSDGRLLLGGNCNYSGQEFGREVHELRQRMANVFPQLSDVRIDHCWDGPLDLTANRLPDVGWLAPQVMYAHGFGGHGVAAANLVGKLLAEATMGTAERFDVLTRIGHIPFIGGTFTKRPLFMLGMLWYQLRDRLQRF